MNIRTKSWKVVAAIFAAINLAGAVYAAAEMGEPMHMAVHVGLLLIVAAVYLPRRDPARPRAASLETAPAGDPFARLERSLESVALNVERIGEAQRFHAKVLEDRKRAE